jgi:hypothetical protein
VVILSTFGTTTVGLLSPGTVVVILSSFGTTTVGLLSPGTVTVILSSCGTTTVAVAVPGESKPTVLVPKEDRITTMVRTVGTTVPVPVEDRIIVTLLDG